MMANGPRCVSRQIASKGGSIIHTSTRKSYPSIPITLPSTPAHNSPSRLRFISTNSLTWSRCLACCELSTLLISHKRTVRMGCWVVASITSGIRTSWLTTSPHSSRPLPQCNAAPSRSPKKALIQGLQYRTVNVSSLILSKKGGVCQRNRDDNRLRM
jgi:hypothetical protein